MHAFACLFYTSKLAFTLNMSQKQTEMFLLQTLEYLFERQDLSKFGYFHKNQFKDSCYLKTINK